MWLLIDPYLIICHLQETMLYPLKPNMNVFRDFNFEEHTYKKKGNNVYIGQQSSTKQTATIAFAQHSESSNRNSSVFPHHIHALFLYEAKRKI